MPELIEISGIDYSQGLPTPGTGDIGQEGEKLPLIKPAGSELAEPTPFYMEALGAIAISVAIGATMGSLFGLLFTRKWSLESAARGAAIAGMITTFRAFRIGMSDKKEKVALLEIVI